MKKEILFVLLKDFADWEGAYIAPNLNLGVEPGSESKYIVKTVSVRKEPVVSIGGFKVLPDYGIHDIPADYAGIVLIGGMSWFTPEAETIVPLVKEAIEKKRLVAGICLRLSWQARFLEPCKSYQQRIGLPQTICGG